jgi:hypothetical protein
MTFKDLLLNIFFVKVKHTRLVRKDMNMRDYSTLHLDKY